MIDGASGIDRTIGMIPWLGETPTTCGYVKRPKTRTGLYAERLNEHRTPGTQAKERLIEHAGTVSHRTLVSRD